MSEDRPGGLTRRRFLGTSLAAAAAPLAGPEPVIGPAPKTGPVVAASRGSRMNVACIGLGQQMQGHLNEITANLHQNLIAVCDVDHNRISLSKRANPAAFAR